MENEDYKSYIGRAEFFNATGRTLDGLHGLMFRKNPIIECDEKYRQYLENVDCKGHTAEQFISDVAYDTLMTGWGGILVDTPNSNGMSQKDAEDNEAYPYIVYYKPEDIINNRVKQNGRHEDDSVIVLKEKFEEESGDEFNVEIKDRYRVLDVLDGNYNQRVYVDGEKDGEILDIKKNEKKQSHIPFWWATSRNPEKPMLLDLVNVNFAWYRKSADYENALHYGSVFMPYSVGFTPQSEVKIHTDPTTGEQWEEEIAPQPIRVKCNAFTHFPEGTTVGSLEFDRSSSNNSLQAMQNDEERMAILGARIISAEKRGVESAETAKIHRAGENSVLATFANNLSLVMSKVFKYYLEICTGEENVKVSVKINTDYEVAKMSSSELTALVALWQSGGIAKRDLFNNLKEGEILESDRDFEEMQSEIEEEGSTNTSILPE